MRFFVELPRRWPWAGLAFAVGLLLGDAVFVVRPTFGLFDGSASSVWPREPMLAAFAAYLVLGTAGDWIAQAVWPAARRGFVPRMVVLMVLGAGLALGANEARSVPLFGFAAGFALLALGRFTWPVATLATVVALWPGLAPPETFPPPALAAAAPESAPSFVVVVLDTMRRDRTSPYGHERDTTPNLAHLAERGVRFDRAYGTASWSLPSHASLFTGLGTEKHGAHNEHLTLRTEHATLAAVLAQHGWETVSSSGNPWVSRGTGMVRGFQRVHEPWRTVHMKWFLLFWRVWAGLAATDRDKGGADTLTELHGWLAERDASRPYLLFVNLNEAHGPYQAVPRHSRQRFTDPALSLGDLEDIGTRGWEASYGGKHLPESLRPDVLDLYDGAIHAADAYLGEILALVGDEPIVVVVSDHGEFAGEKTLYGHPNLLYEGLLQIPFVMAGGSLPRSATVDSLVSIVDVMPTLLGMAGIAPPVDLDGIDLRPLIAGAVALDRTLTAEAFRPPDSDKWGEETRADLAAELDARKRAVIRGQTKRIVGEDGTDRVYDLATDPGEQRPMPTGAAQVAADVPEWAADAGAAAAPLDEGQRRALEALGYLESE